MKIEAAGFILLNIVLLIMKYQQFKNKAEPGPSKQRHAVEIDYTFIDFWILFCSKLEATPIPLSLENVLLLN